MTAGVAHNALAGWVVTVEACSIADGAVKFYVTYNEITGQVVSTRVVNNSGTEARYDTSVLTRTTMPGNDVTFTESCSRDELKFRGGA